MSDVKSLTLKGSSIPFKLQNIPDAPKELFYRGIDLDLLLNKPVVAIVGSRKVDSYGSYVTKMLAHDLAAKGVVIVSGLALGVDALAHSSSLAVGGKTIAVLPSGIDTIYPRTNSVLGRNIMHQGGVVSEHDGAYAPREYDFLIRNRLISGLADIVIVTQAASRSGSLNTARHALDQGKTVMAVPGPITNPLCEGPNNLIKMGASVATSAQDVLHLLNISSYAKEVNYELLAQNQAELDIISNIKQGVSDGEELLRLSRLSAPEFNMHITMLELRGVVSAMGGNTWVLK